MTFHVDDLIARLPEMLAEVEAGHEVVLARGLVPVAKVERWTAPSDDVDAAIAEQRANRKNYQPITLHELVAWKNEDER